MLSNCVNCVGLTISIYISARIGRCSQIVRTITWRNYVSAALMVWMRGGSSYTRLRHRSRGRIVGKVLCPYLNMRVAHVGQSMARSRRSTTVCMDACRHLIYVMYYVYYVHVVVHSIVDLFHDQDTNFLQNIVFHLEVHIGQVSQMLDLCKVR